MSKIDELYLKEAMKFKSTFDGKYGINNLKPLKFRNKCTIWYKRVSKIKGFNKDYGLLVLTTALTDDAEQLFDRNRNNEIKTFKKFIQWFDITFNITTLRRDLSDKINNFKLNKQIPRLKIVEEFEALYDLFKLSGEFATQTLKDYTEFTDKKLLTILTQQFRDYDRKFNKEWNDMISRTGNIPDSLEQLKEYIVKIDDIMIKKSLVNKKENNNNNNNLTNNINTFTPFENDNITDTGSINAVQNQNYHNNNYNNNNYYNNNQYFRGRGRGKRGSYRGNYRGGGNYRGRGYRGSYRGNRYGGSYNGSGRGRGRNYNNNNNFRGRRGRGNYNNNQPERSYFWPDKNQKDLSPISYVKLQCYQCNKWGHRAFYCKYMNHFFPQVLEAYNQSKINNYNNSINNIINKTKTRNKQNNNNNNSDSSDSDNENNPSLYNNPWDSHEKYSSNKRNNNNHNNNRQ